MQSVGIRLREARERRGYSLSDINSRTRINPKNLAAIERDEVNDISSPFFYRSFVKQYAETVGLDFQILSAGVETLAGHMRQPDLPGQGEHRIVRVAPLQARPKRDWSWVVPGAFLLGIVALGSGGYTYLRYFDPAALQNSIWRAIASKPSAAKGIPSAVVNPTLVNQAHTRRQSELEARAGQTPSVKASATPALPGVTEAAVQAPLSLSDVPVTDKIHLELAATERTWLSVSADGKPAYTGILEPLETKILDGQENARLRTGNAGGVTIIFNGKLLGAIGPRGTTRTVTFSKTGYEIEPGDGARLTPVNHIGG